jgi:serine/threonine-protein kinase
MRSLLPALAVDALEDAERDQARAHVAACAVCAAEVATLTRVLAYEDDEGEEPPPEDVWARIVAGIEDAVARAAVPPVIAEVPPAAPWLDVDAAALIDTPPAEKKLTVSARVAPPAPLEDDPFAIGPYTLLEVISRGAMGVVFRARHRQTGRVLALKVLHEELARSPLFVRRFREEAQALARLEHPGIVPIHEVGQASGQHYIAMGLVEGEPLDAHVRRSERWEVARVLGAVEAVARAAHHAHANGVVHRDLKPENVLVGRDGRVVLTDFGLAAQTRGERGVEASGEAHGTPHYMAPEQVRGEAVDRRADVWALGVLLYQLLTHELPFPGESAVDVQQRVLDDEPTPPTQLDPRLDANVEAVVLRALEKDPSHRYPNALDLADDLARAARGERVEAAHARPLRRWRPERRRARPPRFLLGALSGVLVASGAAAYAFAEVRARAALEQEAEQTRRSLTTEAARVLSEAHEGLAWASHALDDARAALERGDAADAVFRAGHARGRVDEVVANLERADATGLAAERLTAKSRALRRDADLLLARAQAALARPDDAAQVLARVVADAPNDLTLRKELARAQAGAGQLDLARASLEAGLRIAPDDPELHLELARVELQRGQVQPAVEALARALSLDPLSVDAYLLRAEARLQDPEGALRDARRAAELDPGRVGAWLLIGKLEHALDRLDDAHAAFSTAIDRGPDQAEPLAARAIVRLDLGRPLEAARDLEQIVERKAATPRVLEALGVAREAIFDEDGARRAYEEATLGAAVDPVGAASAHARLARLWLAQADEVRCRVEAEDRLRVRGGGAPPRLDALLLETARLQVRRLERARAAVAAALRLAPTLAEAHLAHARLALADDDVAGAAVALARVKPPEAGRTRAPWPAVGTPAEVAREVDLLDDELASRGGDEARAPNVDVGARARSDRPSAREPAAWFARQALVGEERLRRLWSRARAAETERAWAAVTACDPRDAAAWLARARHARRAGRLDDAVLLLGRAAALRPSVGLELEAELFGEDLPAERDAATGRPVNVRDVPRASRAYAAALEVEEPVARARAAIAWGSALLRQSAAARSREALERARAALRRAVDAWGAGDVADDEHLVQVVAAADLLARVHEALGDAASATASRLELRGVRETLTQRWLAAAGHHVKQEEHDEALRLLDLAVAVAPDRADAWWERAHCLWELGDVAPATLDWARAVQLDPARLDASWTSFEEVAYVVDLERVLQEVDRVREDHPADARLPFLRAFFAYVRTEKRVEQAEVERGVADAEAALVLDRDFVAARALRALLLIEAASGRAHALDDALEVAGDLRDVALARWAEAVVWALRAGEPSLANDEVVRRQGLVVTALKAARAGGLDVAARVMKDPRFEALRQAGVLDGLLGR